MAAQESAGLDAYEVLQVIGKGSFGVVSKIKRKSDGKVRRARRARGAARAHTTPA